MGKQRRVAVASLDGRTIHEHFGRAEFFLIVDLRPDGTYDLVERRGVEPLCVGAEHTAQGLAARVAALGDCSAVLAARIGPAAQRALEMNGIAAFEHPGLIRDALMKLARYDARAQRGISEEQ